MAQRKVVKHKKPAHHRSHRGRVGAIPKINVMDTLQAGLGLILGTMGATMVQKYVTFLPQKVVSVLELGAGIMFTGSHNKIVQGAAWGVAGAGAMGLAHETGILRGVDEMVSGMFGESGGGEDHHYMAGMPNHTMLSGMPNSMTLGTPETSQMPTDYAAYPMTMGM